VGVGYQRARALQWRWKTWEHYFGVTEGSCVGGGGLSFDDERQLSASPPISGGGRVGEDRPGRFNEKGLHVELPPMEPQVHNPDP